jgi:hypothetical protein
MTKVLSVIALCLAVLATAKVAEACIFCGDYENCIIAKALALDNFEPLKGLKASEIVKSDAEVKAGIGKKKGIGTLTVFCRGNKSDIATCVAKDAHGAVQGTPGRFKLSNGKFVNP